jgi:hypothetical protein
MEANNTPPSATLEWSRMNVTIEHELRVLADRLGQDETDL